MHNPPKSTDSLSSEIDQNYRDAGFHATQTWGRNPAIILIDFAQAYYDPASPLYGGELCKQALKHANLLADAARQFAEPLFLTKVEYDHKGINGGAFYQKIPALVCFDKGNEYQDFAADLNVHASDIVIDKQYPSAFFATSLSSTLRWMQVDTLLIAGLSTSGCVRATCVDSISNGFITIIVEDAVGDRAEKPHKANLFDMSAKYADLCRTEEAITYLKSTHEKSNIGEVL
ncbi:MAG: isochorismatase family protein [Rhizobiaceae bacterium]